jgi:hypothetical protein
VSRRSALIRALVLSSFTAAIAREARAQAAPSTVTILRRTPVRTAPSDLASTIVYLTPSTFEVTQFRVHGGFVRLLRRDIDRRSTSRGYGYIATVDVAIDSASTDTVSTRTAGVTSSRSDTASRTRPDSIPPARLDTTTVTRADATPRAVESTQTRSFPLETAAGLRPVNVSVEPTTHDGRRGLRVALSDDAQRRLQQLPPDEQARFEQLVVIDGTDFSNGVIEAEIAGTPASNSGEGARGFVGIAFRLQPDMRTYDAFYLRPTNGRADDQERRNHSAQYISHPAWPWYRLRQESPGRYEAYVDLVPDTWTPIRIEVHGAKARLFVNGQAQPTLIVNDVKSGERAHGAIALWTGPGTVAHFRNLRVSPSDR